MTNDELGIRHSEFVIGLDGGDQTAALQGCHRRLPLTSSTDLCKRASTGRYRDSLDDPPTVAQQARHGESALLRDRWRSGLAVASRAARVRLNC
jgi:hypothetical protein